ncbi:MAG TPA: 6-bladed beta-propeller [Fodinibius sp.]|nr:6-bladed beta-propeller [Fodinibius sp.]
MKLVIFSLLLTLFVDGCSGGKSGEPPHNPAKENTALDSNRVNNSTATANGKKPIANSETTNAIQFVREQEFKSTDEVIIGQIATVVVDDKDHVFIADKGQTTIQVFNRDGSYRASIGNQGKGPGEFTAISPNTTMKIHSNRLYVSDVTEGFQFFPHRIHVFSLEDLSFLQTIKLIPKNKNNFEKLQKYNPKRFYPLTGGRLLVAYHRAMWEYRDTVSYIRYVIQDSTGTILTSPILEQKDLTYLVYTYPSGNSSMHSFPFYRRSLFALSNDNDLYAANTEEFKIQVYNTQGEPIRTFQHPFNNQPLRLRKLIDRYRKNNYMARLDRHEGDNVALKMIRQAPDIPDTWPALQSMFFDDKNQLWISTIIAGKEVYKWYVLKKSGEITATFTWPRDKPIEKVRNGKLYTRETDQETGLEEIVRYNIVME